MLNWFNALVTAAVLIILIIAAAESLMGLEQFEPLALAGAVSMLLLLPVLYKLAGRRRGR
jgi:hypothetical protein